jgi:hypothetical protein
MTEAVWCCEYAKHTKHGIKNYCQNCYVSIHKDSMDLVSKIKESGVVCDKCLEREQRAQLANVATAT